MTILPSEAIPKLTEYFDDIKEIITQEEQQSRRLFEETIRLRAKISEIVDIVGKDIPHSETYRKVLEVANKDGVIVW